MGKLKDLKLATTVSVTSNYAGTEAGELIGASFKEANTISRNLVTVLPDIDFQISLRKIAYADGRVDYACGFAPTGSVTLTEKLLTPKKIMNQQEICKEDLRQIWSSATMGFSAHNDQMPSDVAEALITEILADTAEAVDKDIWQGDATNTGEFDGFIKLFAADGSVVKPTALAAAIDKSNVIAETEKVINATPQAVAQASDVVWGISYNWALALEQAMVSAGISNGLGGNAHQLQYGSRVFEVINGLPDNTMVVYRRKNLNFGTGLLNDFNEIRIADGDDFGRLDDQVRYNMVYTAGVQYYNSGDIVYYVSL